MRSCRAYTVLHSAQGLMLILRAILYSTSFQFGGPASRLNSGGWIGGISCGITICSCLFVSWWTFSRCSSSSCFGIFRILLFSLAKRSLMNLKEFLLNRVLVCSFFLQSFLKFSALLKDSRIQGFIRHKLNYTEYNQYWNVSQVRSAQWTVQNM